MSVVYLAHDPRVQRDVAIKVLPRDVRDQPNVRKRFEREARTIAALEHPCIVPIYDFGEEDRQPYLVMRYMFGGSLADRLSSRTSLAQAAKIVTRIASGLDEAHAKGVIHRDLKPGNILFDAGDQAFLSDFGIVKITEIGQPNNSTGALVLGTPAYMSPEQALGKPLDNRTDVYSLGAVLYEMLTGMPPYTGPTGMSVAMKHVVEPVPNALERRPDLPTDVQAVIAKAMAKEASDRYASTGDLAIALNAVVQAYPQQAAQVPEAIDLPHESPASPTDTEVTTLPKRRAQKVTPEPSSSTSRRQLIGGAALALALVTVGLIGTLVLTGQFNGKPSAAALPTETTSGGVVSPVPAIATGAGVSANATATVLPADVATEAPTEIPIATATKPGSGNTTLFVQVNGNVRSGPSTAFSIVANNRSAEAIAFTRVGDEVWYEVKLNDGRTGWASSSVVKPEPPADEAALEILPAAENVPPTPFVPVPVAPTRVAIPTVVVFPSSTPFVPPTVAITASPTITPATATPFPTVTPVIPTPTVIP